MLLQLCRGLWHFFNLILRSFPSSLSEGESYSTPNVNYECFPIYDLCIHLKIVSKDVELYVWVLILYSTRQQFPAAIDVTL